jgi:hypothetical protein
MSTFRATVVRVIGLEIFVVLALWWVGRVFGA